MSTYLECPYCQKTIRDPEECNEQDSTYEHECPHCEKRFVFTVSWTKSYSEEKADCLNGAPHDYQPIKGWPEWFFVDRRRCSMCQGEIQLKPAVPPERAI